MIMINSVKYSPMDGPRVEAALRMINPYLSGLDSYYPCFNQWFHTRVLPGMYDGTRSILQATDKGSIVAFAILKHDIKEQKICTFYVDKRCRRSGIGSILMGSCLDFFSKKPIITVTESLIESYSSLLSKFQFGRPLVWESAYKKNVTEYIFDPAKTILPTENNGFYYLE